MQLYFKIMVILGAVLYATAPASASSKDQITGTIIVHKIVVGDPAVVGSDAFTYYVNGVAIGTGGNGATFSLTTNIKKGVDTGNTVSETAAPTNKNQYRSSVTCISDIEGEVATNDGTSTIPGDVSLKRGETVTCTFTNTLVPKPAPKPHHHHKPHKQDVKKHHVKLPKKVTLTPKQVATGAIASGG